MKLKGYYTAVPDTLMESDRLSLADKAVFIALLHFARKDTSCWPSVHTIAQFAHVTDRWVHLSIKHLQTEGWITGKGLSNVNTCLYQLSEPQVCTQYPPSSMYSVQRGYVLSTHEVSSSLILKKREKRDGPSFSSSQDKSDQDKKQEASLACSYADGRFHVEHAARAWLQERHPSINLDTIVTRAEARLSKQKPREIVNALAYLDACCSRAGRAIPEQPVHSTRTSVPATESRHLSADEIYQAEQDRLLHVKQQPVKKS